MFDFPKYQELSKDEQDPVVHHRLDEPLLVVGPPGSGKTVLALYRSNNLKARKDDSVLLVYSHVLNNYLQCVVDGNEKKLSNLCRSTTWHSWLREYYRSIKGVNPPTVAPFLYEWPQIMAAVVTTSGTGKRYFHILIDEGQDLPEELYTFIGAISNSYTIFADENQRITDTQSTIGQITNAVGDIKTKKLTRNYRNTIEIARVAKEFYVGLATGIPDLPKRKGQKPECRSGIVAEQDKFIRTFCRNNSESSIGIFLPTKDEVNKLYLQFYSDDDLKPRIQAYTSDCSGICPECGRGLIMERRTKKTGKKFYGCSAYPKCSYTRSRWLNQPPLKFLRSSITLLTHQSGKGLEFQNVIIPHLTDAYWTKSDVSNKMKFYVLTSRARERLIFCKDNSTVQLLSGLPDGLVDFKKI